MLFIAYKLLQLFHLQIYSVYGNFHFGRNKYIAMPIDFQKTINTKQKMICPRALKVRLYVKSKKCNKRSSNIQVNNGYQQSQPPLRKIPKFLPTNEKTALE